MSKSPYGEHPLSAVATKNTLPGDQSLSPAFLYLLADHLDATLAAGEDLIAYGRSLSGEANVGQADVAGDEARQSDGAKAVSPEAANVSPQQIVRRLHTLELSLASRLLKSREHAHTLAQADHRFALLAKAFAAGITPFHDAALKFGDTTQHEFQTGNDLAVYLRSRQLIAPDAPGPSAWDPRVITEDFPILGLVPVGVILDNTAMFLDALDAAFDLYPAEADDTLDGLEHDAVQK